MNMLLTVAFDITSFKLCNTLRAIYRKTIDKGLENALQYCHYFRIMYTSANTRTLIHSPKHHFIEIFVFIISPLL